MRITEFAARCAETNFIAYVIAMYLNNIAAIKFDMDFKAPNAGIKPPLGAFLMGIDKGAQETRFMPL